MNKSIDIPVYGWSPDVGELVSAIDAQKATGEAILELQNCKSEIANKEDEIQNLLGLLDYHIGLLALYECENKDE